MNNNNEIIQSLSHDLGVFKLHNLMPSPHLWNAEFFSACCQELQPERNKIAIVAPLNVSLGSGLFQPNQLDAVISLPAKWCSHTTAPVALFLLKYAKADDTVLFIHARPAQVTTPEQAQAQLRKMVSAYQRVRAAKPQASEFSSPVCYASLFDDNRPGTIIDGYAYLAAATTLAAQQYSANPADYLATS